MNLRRLSASTALAMATMLVTALVQVGSVAHAAASPALPSSIAAIGDSITQAYDVCCSYGNHPTDSWSTGSNPSDGVSSHYERILAANPSISGNFHNDAVTGAKVGGGGTQAQAAVSQRAQYVTILIGANDVCTSSSSTMTSTSAFTSAFESVMSQLESGLPAGAHIFVSSIPNIYELWSVLHNNFFAEAVWSYAHICQSMLSRSNTESDRQRVLAQEQADNNVLGTVCKQYAANSNADCQWDNLATFNYPFSASQVSTLDYFHPNLSGQAKLASVTWGASWWPTVP